MFCYSALYSAMAGGRCRMLLSGGNHRISCKIKCTVLSAQKSRYLFVLLPEAWIAGYPTERGAAASAMMPPDTPWGKTLPYPMAAASALAKAAPFALQTGTILPFRDRAALLRLIGCKQMWRWLEPGVLERHRAPGVPLCLVVPPFPGLC